MFEIGPLELDHLLHFFEHKKDDQEHVEDVKGEDDERLVRVEIHRVELESVDHTARGQELEENETIGEEVEIDIVEGELDKQGPRVQIDPVVGLQERQVTLNLGQIGALGVELEHVATAQVVGVQAGVGLTVDAERCRVLERFLKVCVGSGRDESV